MGTEGRSNGSESNDPKDKNTEETVVEEDVSAPDPGPVAQPPLEIEDPLAKKTGLLLFNVTAYGANGSDDLDDSDAFQAAIDAAAEVGGTVIVPEASAQWVIEQTLVIEEMPEGLEFGSQLIKMVGIGENKPKIKFKGTQQAWLTIKRSYVSVENFEVTFDAVSTGLKAVYLDTTSSSIEYAQLKNLHFKGPHAGIADAKTSNIIVSLYLTDITLEASSAPQIDLEDGFAYIFLTDVAIQYQAAPSGPAIRLFNNAGAILENVQVYAQTRGAVNAAAPLLYIKDSAAIWLRNSNFSNGNGHGIYVDDSQYLYLSNVESETNNSGGLLFASSHHLFLTEVSTKGISSGSENGIHALSSTNIQVTGGTFKEHGRSGVALQDSSRSSVVGIGVDSNGVFDVEHTGTGSVNGVVSSGLTTSTPDGDFAVSTDVGPIAAKLTASVLELEQFSSNDWHGNGSAVSIEDLGDFSTAEARASSSKVREALVKASELGYSVLFTKRKNLPWGPFSTPVDIPEGSEIYGDNFPEVLVGSGSAFNVSSSNVKLIGFNFKGVSRDESGVPAINLDNSQRVISQIEIKGVFAKNIGALVSDSGSHATNDILLSSIRVKSKGGSPRVISLSNPGTNLRLSGVVIGFVGTDSVEATGSTVFIDGLSEVVLENIDVNGGYGPSDTVTAPVVRTGVDFDLANIDQLTMVRIHADTCAGVGIKLDDIDQGMLSDVSAGYCFEGQMHITNSSDLTGSNLNFYGRVPIATPPATASSRGVLFSNVSDSTFASVNSSGNTGIGMELSQSSVVSIYGLRSLDNQGFQTTYSTNTSAQSYGQVSGPLATAAYVGSDQ